jgi:oxaloacetate decarboxylase (Na+ extruding) subunit gamma
MNEMMSSGIELMLTGMGIVYAFLAMLVVAIKIMTALVTRYFPEMPVDFVVAPSNTNEPLVIAAITAAVHQYRSKHNKVS